jgi:hypothetical protein
MSSTTWPAKLRNLVLGLESDYFAMFEFDLLKELLQKPGLAVYSVSLIVLCKERYLWCRLEM